MAYTREATITAANKAHWMHLEAEILNNNTGNTFDLRIRVIYELGSGGNVAVTKKYTDADGTGRPYLKVGSTTHYYNRGATGTWSGPDEKTIATVTFTGLSKSSNPQDFSCTWREFIVNNTTVASKTTTFTLTVPAATYTISYNGNGYSGKSATATKTHGEGLTIRNYFADVNSYLIKYNKNNGSSTPADQRSELKQVAWCSDAKGNSSTGGSGTLRREGYTITGNRAQTIYAIWEQQPVTLASAISRTGNKATNTYTISYNNNGGTGSITNGTLTRNTAYAFDKWAQGSTSGTKYAAGASFTPSYKLGENHSGDTITMYATWKNGSISGSITLSDGAGFSKSSTTANQYLINFEGNGGTPSASSKYSTKTTSYSFNKWNTKSDGTGTSYNKSATYSGDANLTLYAIWSSSSVNNAVTTPTASRSATTASRVVTFNTTSNGGSCSTSTLTSTATVTYSCKGWYTATSGGTERAQAGASYTPTSNETLYAQWNSSTGTYSAITLPSPTKTGYVFKGWYTAASGGTKAGGAGDSYTPTSTTTLYAQWTAKELTVIFNKNDGSSSTASQTFIYGAAGNKFGYNNDGTAKWPPTAGSYADLYGFGKWYKDGYKILGWSENSSATTATYSTYSGVTDGWIQGKIPENNQTGTVNLYAVWEPMGLVRIWNGSSFQLAIPYVYNGGWQQAMGYIYKNSTDKWQFGI